MRTILKGLVIFSFVLSIVIVSSGCSGVAGDSSTISISLGIENGKAAVPIDELRHIITLDGPTGRQTHSISGRGTIRATVAPGLWRLDAEGYYGNELYSKGSTIAEVKIGKNTSVTIMMTIIWGETPTGGGGGGRSPQKPLLVADFTATSWSGGPESLDNLITNNAPVLPELTKNITIMLDYDPTTPTSFFAHTAAISAPSLSPGQEYTVTLISPPNKRIEITNDGYLTSQMFIFSASTGTTVTLNLGYPGYPENSMLTLDGGGYISSSSLIVVSGTGTDKGILNMYDPVTLQNNKMSGGSSGGAVNVSSGGEFYMYGGNITDNEAGSGNGGGVSVSSTGAFYMYGGNITLNKAISSGGSGGGGVFSEGNFVMESGNIYNNDATVASGYIGGGGVCITGGSFEMKGGTIGPNTARLGAGVLVNASSGTPFIMSGSSAKIYGNIATGSGGGVYIYGGAQFDMNAGTIGPDNIANGLGGGMGGGGLYLNSAGGFTMSGSAVIIENKAMLGGGVNVLAGNLTLSGNAAIIGNIAQYTGGANPMGGGVYFNSPGYNLKMENGTPKINNNSAIYSAAAVLGGGVYHIGGDFYVDAGEIKGNTVSSTPPGNGGGVFANVTSMTAYFEKNGGTIDATNSVVGGSPNSGHVMFLADNSSSYGFDTMPVPPVINSTMTGSISGIPWGFGPWEFFIP